MKWRMSANYKPSSLKAIHSGTIVWFGLRTAASRASNIVSYSFCASRSLSKISTSVFPGTSETDERVAEAVFQPRREGQDAAVDSTT